jgi:hypothetical protein
MKAKTPQDLEWRLDDILYWTGQVHHEPTRIKTKAALTHLIEAYVVAELEKVTADREGTVWYSPGPTIKEDIRLSDRQKQLNSKEIK